MRYFVIILFCALYDLIYAQNLTIKGIVLDEKNEPLIGVSVKEKNQNNGVITGLDGRFLLTSKATPTILVFSYIGMKTQELEVKKNTSLKIIMDEDSKILEEVVVIGYGAVKKKELTGAVAQVKGDDLNQMITSNLGDALQGKVAGVNFTSNDGTPGGSGTILIRGISSVTGSNTPLYVVDGIPQEGDPRISPNDISSIDILKDAASCAIYGTRGAAGVILITTKKGKAGQMKMSINASYGFQTLRSAIELMDANEQTYYELVRSRNNSAAYDSNVKLGLHQRNNAFMNNTDLRGVIFDIKRAHTQDYSFDLSGGRDGLTYNVNGSLHNMDGVLINSSFNRYTTRVNLNYTKNKFSLFFSSNISIEKQQPGATGIISQALKYSPFQDVIKPGNLEPQYSINGDWANQLNWIANYLNVKESWHTIKPSINININYNILPKLRLSTRFGWGEINGYQRYFKPFQEVYDEKGELKSKPYDSNVKRSTYNNSSLTWDVSLNYEKKIKSHTIKLLGVFSTETYNYDGFSASKSGIIDNEINSFTSTTMLPDVSAMVNWNQKYTNNLVGVLGRIMYDWKSRYLLSLSARADASSKFNKDNRWGVFPSISGAWNVSDEKFWKKPKKIVNTFRLRYSHGTTGNQNFSPYSFINVIKPGYDAAFGETGKENVAYGATQDSFANPNVKWETSIQDNYGIDLAFLNNRITLTAEYYNTRKKDMLFNVLLPNSSGVYGGTNMVLNVGNMTNSGYELALTYTKSYKGFWFRGTGTFSTNKNIITHLPGTNSFMQTNDWGLEGTKVTVLAEGHEAGAFYLYKTNGVVNTYEKLAEYKKLDPSARMGDLIYCDVSGDGIISESDRTYCGSGLPEFELGLNLMMAYKSFDVNMQWYSALGNEIMNGTKYISYLYERNAQLVSQWSEVNPTSPIPAFRHKSQRNYWGNTDLWMEDGSYVRLKYITVGYTFSRKILNKLGMSKFRLYVTAQNPLTFTNYSGYNPEVGGAIQSRGMDRANYPSTSTYTVGMNLSF